MTIEPPATAPVAHEPTTSTEAKCNSRSSSQVRSASRPRATAAAGAAATGPAATIPLALNLTPDLEAIAHLKPLTCGGKAISTDMVHLALTEQHLGQESNDLNFALWDVLRVNMRQSELWEQYEVWDKVANGHAHGHAVTARFDTTTVSRLAATAEHGLLASMLYTICEIHRGLNLEGISMMHPLQTLGIRKAAGSVAPLSVVVQLAQEAKAEGHRRYKAGQFASGVKAYLFALVSMFPWVASPLVFDPDTAFQTGIVQIQTRLWTSLAGCMRQQHIRSRAERPNDKRTDWLHLADMCTRIVLNSRFVTRRMLARAYTLAADINEEIAQDEAEFSAELTTAAQAQRRLSALVQKSDAANPHHAWAHEHCIDTHAGCGCGPDDVVLVS